MKRGHTNDCLDAVEAYLPCICGADEKNRKVAVMTHHDDSDVVTTAGPLEKAAVGFFQTSVTSGFWPGIETLPNTERPFVLRNFGEMIALAHSELSEALEEHRSGLPFVYESTLPGKEGKPEGIAIEIVDCMIRCFDTLASMRDPEGLIDGYTIDELFKLKGDYNKGREAKHGRAY